MSMNDAQITAVREILSMAEDGMEYSEDAHGLYDTLEQIKIKAAKILGDTNE